MTKRRYVFYGNKLEHVTSSLRAKKAIEAWNAVSARRSWSASFIR